MNVLIDGALYILKPKPQKGRLPFGELIKLARRRHNQSLEQTALACDLSKSHLWELEQGRSYPTLAVIQRLLQHFGLKFEQIEDTE